MVLKCLWVGLERVLFWTAAETHTGTVQRWIGGLLGFCSMAFPPCSIPFLLLCQVLVWGTEGSWLESALKHQ